MHTTTLIEGKNVYPLWLCQLKIFRNDIEP